MQKINLKKMLAKASTPDQRRSDSFETFSKEALKLRENIARGLTVELLLAEFSDELETFKGVLNSDIDVTISNKWKDLQNRLENKVAEIKSALVDDKKISQEESEAIKKQLAIFMESVKEEVTQKDKTLAESISVVNQSLEEEVKSKKELNSRVTSLQDEVNKLRLDTVNRFSQQGGGAPNRQIRVEGVDVLTKYTDVNFVGVTSSILTSVDSTNKRVNIRFPSGSGGGASPGGDDASVQINQGGNFGGAEIFYDNSDSNTLYFVTPTQTLSNNPALGLGFTGGTGDGSGHGGNVNLTGGFGGATGAGGAVNLAGGFGGGASGTGGGITIVAGDANGGNGNGGSVEIIAGFNDGSGSPGLISLSTANGNSSIVIAESSGVGIISMAGDTAVLDTTNVSGNKTFAFPNKSGTFALTNTAPSSLFDHFASVGNVNTGEDDLYSDTIAASQLNTNGDKLEGEYGGVFVSSGTATREIKLYFGGTVIFDTGALTLSLSAAWTCYATIIRVSATVIRYMISFTTEGAALAAYTAVGELTGLTLSNTNVMKITGQAAGVGAATNDIVAKLGSISFYPAA